METPSLRDEVRTLVRLSLPVAAAQVGTMAMGLVDTAMVGRVSVEALAGASIGNTLVYVTLLASNGLLMGMDPIVSHAHGRGDGRTSGIALQRGAVLALAISVVLSLVWWHAEAIFTLLRQSPRIAEAAGHYVRVQVPSIPFYLGFTALRQQLQGREIMRPAMWATLVANASNAWLNWVLIFGHWGFPALGLEGAGIATAANRAVMFGLLFGLVRAARLLDGAWVPWSRAALDPRGLANILHLGWPVALQIALEVMAFSGATLLVGWIGATSVAAHQVTFNFAALTFMMPLGISQAAATRVGNLLGARHPDRAQRAAWVALGMGAFVMGVAAVIFVVFRGHLPRVLTDEPAVVALSATVFPIAAAFQIFDGVQVVGCGVLRGMGRPRPVAWFNLVAYWGLGLPLGAWWALRAGWGLPGIWWGLCLGLAVVASSLVLWIRARGPAHLAGARPLRA
jgi:MATE family multidrug resistance protein